MGKVKIQTESTFVAIGKMGSALHDARECSVNRYTK
jgi:hypothetical protein